MSVNRLKLSANPLVHKHRNTDRGFADLEYNSQSPSLNGSPPLGDSFEKGDVGDEDRLPEFQRHGETTNIELFYDLFFVANLTTFGTIHEINSKRTLASYVGFFCVLWFTWCQVSLFDVRFVVESLPERIAKACHLGVMVGLAVVGPNFDTLEQNAGTFRAMSLILMVSRFVLSSQYLLVMWHVRHFRNTTIPLVLIAVTNFVAAIIYMGVTFSFGGDKRSYAYRSFYVIAVFEVASNIIVSSMWKVVSFKGSHLVQRMSLLTLIILGEGVIVVCKSLVKIVQNDHAWTSATIGTIVAAISIIYFSYMLYFDSLNREHFGSIRQQIWAFLHFPFHVALVLFLEGTSQFVVWHKMVEAANSVLGEFADVNVSDSGKSSTEFEDLTISLNKTIQGIFTEYPPVNSEVIPQVVEALQIVKEGFTAGNSTSFTAWQEAIGNLASTVVHSIFTTYGFEPGEHAGSKKTLSPQEELDADNDTINLVGIYFFVCAGFTLICIAVLNLLTIRQHTRGSVLRLGTFFTVGLVIALLASMVGHTAWDNFGVSAWILPTVAICECLVLVILHVPLPQKWEEP